MYLIVPMAGLGQRTRLRWKEPKPFITLDDHPLLAHSIRSVKDLTFEKIIFVGNLSDRLHYRSYWSTFADTYLTGTPHQLLFTEPTRGQADTVQVALDLGAVESDFMIIPCDTAFGGQLTNFDFDGQDGMLGVFESQSENLSFVEIAGDGKVLRTAEKKVISRFASSGLYYFGSPQHFSEALGNFTEDGESYVAPLYNYLIRGGLSIGSVQHDWVIPLGTVNEILSCSLDLKSLMNLRRRF